MKKINQLLGILTLVLCVTFTSCSDDKDQVLPEEKDYSKVMEDFQGKINNMELPSSLESSSNVHAAQAKLKFTYLKGLAVGFSGLFNIPANATSAKSSKIASKGVLATTGLNSRNYVWTAGDMTVNYTISEEADRYSFSYKVESPDFTGTFMDGYSKKDGSYAELTMYGKKGVTAHLKWKLTDSNYVLEIKAADTVMTLDYSLNNNSGSLKSYEGGKLVGEYQWNSDGSGYAKLRKDDGTYETFTWTAE